MNFKKRKYNLVFLLMFMLVIGVFGFEVFFATDTPQVVFPNDSDANEDPTQPGGDPNLPDLPINPDDPNSPSGEGLVTCENEKRDPNVPSAQFPISIVNYALDKLYNTNGKGYESYVSSYSKEMKNVASGVEVTQNVTGSISKSKNIALEDMEFKAKGSMADQAANYLRSFYFENNNVTWYQTPKNNFNKSDYQATEMSLAEYKNTFVLSLAEKPIIDFNAKDFSSGLQTKKDKSGNEYFVIQASAINLSPFAGTYAKYYESTKDIKNVKIKSMEFTFSIYKKSGRIFQISTVEKLTGTHSGTGFAVSSTVTTSQRFSVYTSSFDIKKPL